jgi:hypothetical protein
MLVVPSTAALICPDTLVSMEASCCEFVAPIAAHRFSTPGLSVVAVALTALTATAAPVATMRTQWR